MAASLFRLVPAVSCPPSAQQRHLAAQFRKPRRLRSNQRRCLKRYRRSASAKHLVMADATSTCSRIPGRLTGHGCHFKTPAARLVAFGGVRPPVISSGEVSFEKPVTPELNLLIGVPFIIAGWPWLSSGRWS